MRNLFEEANVFFFFFVLFFVVVVSTILNGE